MRLVSDATLPTLPYGDPGMIEATEGFTECSPRINWRPEGPLHIVYALCNIQGNLRSHKN
jgi:hypothetical protein